LGLSLTSNLLKLSAKSVEFFYRPFPLFRMPKECSDVRVPLLPALLNVRKQEWCQEMHQSVLKAWTLRLVLCLLKKAWQGSVICEIGIQDFKESLHRWTESVRLSAFVHLGSSATCALRSAFESLRNAV
jgi:hypothetical protein